MLQERPCVFFSNLRQASKKDDRTVHLRWSSIGMTRSAQQAGCVPWAGGNIHHVCNPQEKWVMLRIAMLDYQSLSKAFNVSFFLFDICQALRARQCTWQFVFFVCIMELLAENFPWLVLKTWWQIEMLVQDDCFTLNYDHCQESNTGVLLYAGYCHV